MTAATGVPAACPGDVPEARAGGVPLPPGLVALPSRARAEPHGAWSPAVSPDGRTVAYVDDRDGVPALWVRPVGPGRSRRLPTGPEQVLAVSWSRDGAWLAVLVAPGGATRTRVLVVRPDGTQLRHVAGSADAAAFLGAWSASGLLGLSEAAASGEADAYLVDPGSGERQLLASGGLLVVLDLAVDGSRALVRHGPRSRRVIDVVDVVSRERRPLPGVPLDGSTDQGWLSRDGRVAWVRSSAGREMTALLRVELDGGPDPGGSVRVVAERVDAELDAWAVSEDRCTAVVLWNRFGASEAEVLDLESGQLRGVYELPRPVALTATLDADGSRLALGMEGPDDAPDVWVTDLSHWSWRRPRRRPRRRADPYLPSLVDLRSTDGTPLTGWLYRARQPEPGAAVLSLHGGPEWQERPFYAPLYQELAARGISVFAPNVRGSTGFGRTFVEADDGYGRFGVFEDVAASAERLLELGVLEPGRLGVMGRSYGGYLVLASLVWYPELFAAGVDVCGMSDLETFYAGTEPWMAQASYGEYGHPERERELLRALSPLRRIDRLRAPLLVVHGENDTNVPLGESLQLVAAARERGVPVQLLVFPGEGHEVVRAEHRAQQLNATVDFLVATLAPRPEPVAHRDGDGDGVAPGTPR